MRQQPRVASLRARHSRWIADGKAHLARQTGRQASVIVLRRCSPASQVRAASEPLASASATPSPVSEAITAA